MCIKNLIEICGKTNVLKILPSLFITIDTEKIENNQLLCDTNYFEESETIIDTLYTNLKTSDYETVHDIVPIIHLFHEMAIDKAMVDSVVITYLGKNCVRYKNLSEKRFGKTLYLDVHAVRIALTDMQTEQTVRRYIGNGLKFFAGAFFFSFLHKHHFGDFTHLRCLWR
jgi:hypothetical protein